MKARFRQWAMTVPLAVTLAVSPSSQAQLAPIEEPPDDLPEQAVDGTQPWFWDGHGPLTIRDPEVDVRESVRKRKAFRRWWYRYNLMNNPETPLDALALRLDAWERLEQMVAQTPFRSRLQVGTAASTPLWASIGPAPITNWINTGQTVVGQITDIAIHPSDATRWIVAGADGGVWATTTSGTSWAPKTDNQATLSIGAVAYASSNGNIIFAGTGDYTGFGGVGVLKSTNGGTSWTLSGQSTFAGARFHDIRVNPSNANIVIAATSAGLFRSTDGGATWPAALINGEVTDLEVDPTNFNRQYAAVMLPDNIDGLYRSTNGGANWTLLTTVPWGASSGVDDVARMELAIAPSNVNVMYVAVSNPANDAGLKGLWRTANAWTTTPTWTGITTQVTEVNGNLKSSYCFNQCYYNNELIVKPSDANILFTGGLRLYRYNFLTNIWTDIGRPECPDAALPGCVRGIHADIHTMAWTGNRLIVGNDGGLYSTTDDGANWTPHNTGLAITEFYKGSLHPTNASIAQGGTQDNGSMRRPSTGSASWSYADLASDGGDNFFTNNNPDTRWALSTFDLGLVRFKSGVQCNVHESIPKQCNGGVNNDLVCTSNANCPGGFCEAKKGVAFIAPTRLCPKNDEIVLAGTDNVWKTTNMFSANCSPTGSPLNLVWTKVCGSDADGGEYGAAVEAIAFAPGGGTCNTFAFGSNDGDLRITTNGGGTTCTNLDPNNQVRPANITDMALHPCFGQSSSQATNTETLFVTIGQVGGPHVYRTTTALSTRTWSDVTPADGLGIPFDVPHEAILIDPLVPDHVYVGTDLGLWKSTNSGASWTHVAITDGLPYAPIFDLQLNGKTDRLTAFTHGRSAFELSLNRCVGDCNGDGTITVNEIININNIALGSSALCRCPIVDANRDGILTVNEQQQAINNYNNGCP